MDPNEKLVKSCLQATEAPRYQIMNQESKTKQNETINKTNQRGLNILTDVLCSSLWFFAQPDKALVPSSKKAPDHHDEGFPLLTSNLSRQGVDTMLTSSLPRNVDFPTRNQTTNSVGQLALLPVILQSSLKSNTLTIVLAPWSNFGQKIYLKIGLKRCYERLRAHVC